MQAIQSLSETAGAGNRLSPSGLHETGDERFDGCGFFRRNREIGLNLVTGSCATSRAGGTGRKRRLDKRGGFAAIPRAPRGKV